MEETKGSSTETVPTKTILKVVLLLIAIALLITASIYLIKHRPKQKHLLP